MKKIQGTKKSLAVAASAFIAVSILCTLLIFEINNARNLAGQYKEDIKERVIEAEQLRSAQQLLRGTEEARSKMSSYFVPANDTVSFIELVESLGDETNNSVEIDSVDLNSEEEDDYAELNLSISIKGDWNSVFHFLSVLELLPYKVEVDKITLASTLEGQEVGQWSGSLDFSVLKLKQNEN